MNMMEAKNDLCITKCIYPIPVTKMEKLFGKEFDRVLAICEKLYNRHMYPYKNGYPANPATEAVRGYRGFWRERVDKWMEEHPIEAENYHVEKNNWHVEGEKLEKALYGIAKRKHVRIEWGAKSSSAYCPDKFYIYKNGSLFAAILF